MPNFYYINMKLSYNTNTSNKRAGVVHFFANPVFAISTPKSHLNYPFRKAFSTSNNLTKRIKVCRIVRNGASLYVLVFVSMGFIIYSLVTQDLMYVSIDTTDLDTVSPSIKKWVLFMEQSSEVIDAKLGSINPDRESTLATNTTQVYDSSVRIESSRLSREESLQAQYAANNEIRGYKNLFRACLIGGLAFIGQHFLSQKLTPIVVEESLVKTGLLSAGYLYAEKIVSIPQIKDSIIQKYTDEFLNAKMLEGTLLESNTNPCVSLLAKKFVCETLNVIAIEQKGKFVRVCDINQYTTTIEELTLQKSLLQMYVINKPILIGDGEKVVHNLFDNTEKIIETKNNIIKLQASVDNFHKLGADLLTSKQTFTSRFFKMFTR